MPTRLVILLSLLGGAPVAAQICSDSPPFAGTSLQIAAGILFNDNAEAYNIGLGVGGNGVFGGLDAGWTTYNQIDGEAFTIGGRAGAQLPLGEGGAQLCPVATLGFVRGPSAIDYRETDFSLGLDAGFYAVRTKDVQLVPSASLVFANAFPNTGDAQSFGILGVGVAVMFDQRVSLKASVLKPMGLQGASTTFGVRFAVGLGGGGAR